MSKGRPDRLEACHLTLSGSQHLKAMKPKVVELLQVEIDHTQ
jgi:hypothetical protein